MKSKENESMLSVLLGLIIVSLWLGLCIVGVVGWIYLSYMIWTVQWENPLAGFVLLMVVTIFCIGLYLLSVFRREKKEQT